MDIYILILHIIYILIIFFLTSVPSTPSPRPPTPNPIRRPPKPFRGEPNFRFRDDERVAPFRPRKQTSHPRRRGGHQCPLPKTAEISHRRPRHMDRPQTPAISASKHCCLSALICYENGKLDRQTIKRAHCDFDLPSLRISIVVRGQSVAPLSWIRVISLFIGRASASICGSQ